MSEESILVVRVGQAMPEHMTVLRQSERKLHVERRRYKQNVYPLIFEDTRRLGYNALLEFEVKETWPGAGGQCSGQCPAYEAVARPALVVPDDYQGDVGALIAGIDDTDAKLKHCNQPNRFNALDIAATVAGALILAAVAWYVLY